MSIFPSLYLVRHGESVGNLNGAFLGITDSPLTERGISQAQATSRFFEGMTIGGIFSSPLKRAQQTAEIISSQVREPFVVESCLAEQDFGRWDGRPVIEVKETESDEFEAWCQGDIHHRAPMGESLADVQTRIVPFLHAVKEKVISEAGASIIVAHGGIIQLALCHFLNTPTRNMWPYFPPNGSVSHLQFRKGIPVLIQMGATFS